MSETERLFTGYHLITMQESLAAYGLISNGAILVKRGQIEWVGLAADFEESEFTGEVIRGGGRFLSPGLIDCHTHLIWGGTRADEWERRLQGVSYAEIARQGGGILSTVKATRAAEESILYAQARDRIEVLMREGVTTVEIKSGYGLTTADELKMLQVATDLRDSLPIDIVRTFLGAHAVPPEFAGEADAYIDHVCREMLPAVAAHCEAVDVFCEGIAFNLNQTRRVFEHAQSMNLAIRIHAEQLSNLGGASLAASMGALSADHLEYLDAEGVQSLAEHATVAVLLPGAFYFLRESQLPPIELLRKSSVPIAVASDANPGSSPVASLLLMLNMACTLFGLTPAEALAGVTRNAAKAIGLANQIGTIDVGKQADFAAWEIQSPAELAYGIGHNPCCQVFKRGELILDMKQ